VKFYKDEQGLLYIDLEQLGCDAATMLLQCKELSPRTGENQRIVTAFVQTLRVNYKGYTKREGLRAKEAQHMQALIGNPSKVDYKGLVRSKMITNCPILITTADITNKEEIFGPDLASMWGKQSIAPLYHWWQIMWQNLAQWWRGQNSDVGCQSFLCDGTRFLMTLSRNI
jgi:hypothetical protein